MDNSTEPGTRSEVALVEALSSCHDALADHQAGLLSDDELRHALFHFGLVCGDGEALLLDLDAGRWVRYDGITLSECPGAVRGTDVARWKQAVRSLLADSVEP